MEKKTYKTFSSRGHHEVWYISGESRYDDGSYAWDIRIFNRQADMERFIRSLQADGYKRMGVNVCA